MNIQFAKTFQKHYANLPVVIQQKFNIRLMMLFRINPFDPAMNNHALHGEYAGSRSINIAGDYRAVYQDCENDSVRFIDVGTHAQLYE